MGGGRSMVQTAPRSRGLAKWRTLAMRKGRKGGSAQTALSVPYELLVGPTIPYAALPFSHFGCAVGSEMFLARLGGGGEALQGRTGV